MLGFVLSQLALQLLSAILGGVGIFCLIMSFALPALGAHALLLLVSASVIVYFTASRR